MAGGTVRSPILALALLVGCAGPQVLHVDDVTPRGERSIDAVRLLLDAPDEPFRTIAIIESRPRTIFRSLESLKAEIRAEAARLGADALILGLSSSGDPGGTGVTSDGNVVVVGGSREVRVIGRAIVFMPPS
jgi:hypothetical protein